MAEARAEPDWYTDPDGSGGQRYWDGQAWTNRRRPAPASWSPGQQDYAQCDPTFSGQSPMADGLAPSPGLTIRMSRNSLWAIGSAIVLVLCLIVVGVITNSAGGSEEPQTSRPRDTVETGGLSGNRDVWLETVCAPGTLHNGTNVSDATGGASCRPRRDRGESGGLIYYLEYGSDFFMRNSLTQSRFTRYTSGKNSSLVFAFAIRGRGDSALKPLEQFGFTINQVPPRG